MSLSKRKLTNSLSSWENIGGEVYDWWFYFDCLLSCNELQQERNGQIVSLEYVSPAIMLSKSDASFIQHVITHIDEDLELFFTGEAVRNSSSLHNLENLCLGHCRKCGGSNADFVESPANVGLVRINAPLFTTALIGNALEHFNVHVFNLIQNSVTDLSGLSVVRNECHCRKCGGLNVRNAGSAIDRRVILTLILFQVEVNNLSTVSNILTNIVESVSLNTGSERSHLSLLTLVPDDTLDKTLASADGIEINGGSGGLKAHWVSCVDELSIGHPGRSPRGPVPLLHLSHEKFQTDGFSERIIVSE